MMKIFYNFFAILLFILSSSLLPAGNVSADLSRQLEPKSGFDMQTVERGRYLLKISGCNDCHTAGYIENEGKTPEKLWLTGDTFGWRGPWGTTYGSNLRLLADPMTQDQWIDMAKNLRKRPPMPWYNVNDMTTADLGAMYQFLRYLGPAGTFAPEYVPPDMEPVEPYAVFPGPPK